MLLFLLALPSSPAVSALTLPFPASIAFANLSSPLSFNHSNEPRAKENPSALFFSSSKDSEQWSRTISPTLDFANIPFSPFSEWNNTFISAFNVSVGPHPIPPPSPRECRYRCNGARLGTNLNPSSCLQAWTLIPPLERTLSFGPRGKPTIYDVGLPRRYLSSDGTCAIEPLLKPGVTEAHAKPTDAGISALCVIRECAANVPSTGGLGSEFGGDNNLAVTVAKFVPNVECYDHVSGGTEIYDSCQGIIDIMYTTGRHISFATKGSARQGDVVLPRDWNAPPGGTRCQLRALINIPRAISSWYQIWEAATAINAMCIRSGRQGRWRGIGQSGGITVALRVVPTEESP